MSTMIHKPVLVLNASFEPLNICLAWRAMKLVVKGRAKIEVGHEDKLFYSGKMWDEKTGELVTIDFFLPSVIRLLEYRHIPIRTQIVSKTNIFNRDHNTCMYCGNKFSKAELTLDHVIPSSRGGKSTWENLVAACMPCNRRKGDKMLHELKGMKLIRQPKPINAHTRRGILRNMGTTDPLWRKYLFFENEGSQENTFYEEGGSESKN